MGEQFAVVYDIATVVIVLGLVFTGLKKGFASMIVGMAAVFIGFICAMLFSGTISDMLYKNIIEQPLKEAVSEQLDSAMSDIRLTGFSDVDYSKVLVSGTPVGDISPDYMGSSKIMMDLSSVDLSGTGIKITDLEKFGFGADDDLSHLSGKTAEFSAAEINKYGLGRLVTAQVIAVRLQGTELFRQINGYTKAVGEALPLNFGGAASDIDSGGMTTLRELIISMADSQNSVKSAVVNGLIEPPFRTATQIGVFLLIFIVVSALLGIVSSLLKLVNKIPVLGKVNAFFGGVAGFVEGVLTLFLISLIVRLVISVSGGNMLLMNEPTVGSTHLFRIVYDSDFLNIA